MPPIFTFPEVFLVIDDKILIKVDLPAPFGPKRPKKEPFFILRLILSRAFLGAEFAFFDRFY